MDRKITAKITKLKSGFMLVVENGKMSKALFLDKDEMAAIVVMIVELAKNMKDKPIEKKRSA